MSGEHGDCRECGCPGECQWYARAEAAEQLATEAERDRDEAVASRKSDHGILLDAWRERGEKVPGADKQTTIQRVILGIHGLRERAEAAESDRAALREENGRLREALRDVAEWLPALKPAGHSGDEDGGQCYEDCERCQYEAIEARIDAALTSTPVPAVDPATCDHDVSCARCGTRWTR